MISIPVGNILDLCRTDMTFEIVRIEGVQLSVPTLISAYDSVLKSYQLIEKDGYERYKSICLQHRLGAVNPLYDDVGQLQDVIVDGKKQTGTIPTGPCSELTEVGNLFQFVFDAFADHFIVRRGRIMLAEPQLTMYWHRDGPSRRIHVPIITNQGCFMEYRSGNYYHMPADGSAYLVNAEPEHRMLNTSDENRVHLTFELQYY